MDEVGVVELPEVAVATEEAEGRLATVSEPAGGARTPSIDMIPETKD